MNRKPIRFAKALAALGVLAVLAGCASSGTTKKETAAVAVPAPAPTSTPAPAAASTASADQGTVVFFRESKFAGAAVSFKVREKGVELGKLSSGTYFIAHLPAGAHEFEVHSEAKDVLNLEVEAGETYYVQGSISFGVMVGRPNLSPSDATTFESMKPKLKDSAAPKAARKKRR
jgi:hypothetical protein